MLILEIIIINKTMCIDIGNNLKIIIYMLTIPIVALFLAVNIEMF